MNRFLILLAAWTLTAIPASGQGSFGGRPGDAPNPDKLKSLRVAFITERLNLSPDEAEKFWPLYNEYQARRDEIDLRNHEADIATMSDSDVEAHVRAQFDKHEALVDLSRTYLDRFKTVLPRRKAAMVFAIEHQFVQTIVHRLHERRGVGSGEGRRPQPDRHPGSRPGEGGPGGGGR